MALCAAALRSLKRIDIVLATKSRFWKSQMRFEFNSYGGTDQLRLETAEDLNAIEQLDEAFWMATSAPVDQLASDPKLLRFLDPDDNKRVLSKDIRRAFTWMKARLQNFERVTAASESLRRADLNSESDEGRKMGDTAELVLKYLDKSNNPELTLAEVREHLASRGNAASNGDGVILARNQEDEELRTFLEDIVATMDGADDLTGEKGVDTATLDAFLNSSRVLLDWQKLAEESSDEFSSLFPLDEETAACYTIFAAMREQIDHFFRLCRLRNLHQSFDVAETIPAYTADLIQDKDQLDEYLTKAPIAKPNAALQLDLVDNINLRYRDQLDELRKRVLMPLLGTDEPPTSLHVDDWQLISWTFGPYEAWLNAKSGGEVEKLGPQKLESYLNSELPDRIRKLIADDLEIGKELAAVDDLESLILLQRWFMEICRNFVSFHNLYDPDGTALFEAGRLVIGGRVFTLNIKIDDINKHSVLAKDSGILLLYCEVTGEKPEEKFHIVTPVTNLSQGQLTSERRGVLFDNEMKEWDVRIVKVVDNPVSLWDEIKKPFKRIGKLIGDSLDKLSGSAEKQISGGLTQKVGGLEQSMNKSMQQAQTQAVNDAPAQPAQAQAPAAPKSSTREWVFSGSVALAALGSSFAFMTKQFSSLESVMQVLYTLNIFLLVLFGAFVLALIPIVLIADHRLANRDLGLLLHASGWAINNRMRITRRLAKVFSPKPVHPAGFGKASKDLTRRFLARARSIQAENADKVTEKARSDAQA